MLAIIWLEIVKKRYIELCNNIYRSSLLYKADSVNIIKQLKHREACIVQ